MLACTPHPGFGSVLLERGARVTVVDLSTCRRTTRPATTGPPGPTTPGSSLVYRGRRLVAVRRGSRLIAFGTSPDRRWVLYAADPFDSVSILADGVPLRVIPSGGGRSRSLPPMLLGAQYRTWCGSRLVLTSGEGRTTWWNKRLLITGPPSWRPRRIVRLPARAWGSSTCAPDGASIAVQSQLATRSDQPSADRWALWRVSLTGRAAPLTRPPRGSVDESPRYARDGTLYFVRARRDHGRLYALRGGRTVGPLLDLGSESAYFGLRDWSYTVRP